MNTSEDLLIESFTARHASMRIAVVTETFPPEVNGVAMTLGRSGDGLLWRRPTSCCFLRHNTPVPQSLH